MASPLATLRRYQFAFFVFFGVLLMIVFVVGDPLYSWLGGGSGAGRGHQTDKAVVVWRGGNQMTESEIYNERVTRNIVQQFISAILEETRKRNGTPQVQQRLSLSPSERDIVYTKVLATQAEQMGLEVTNESALQYLEKLSADLIPRVEIGRIFQETIGNRISEQQAFNTIKTELAAQNYILLTYPDLTRGQLPAQAWEYYRRLHRHVKAEIAPLVVADLKKKVSKEPSEAEIQAMYDSGKDRYPEPTLPDPGFKRRRKVAFDFIRADRKKFEDEEVAKLRPQVTDQEITEYYDKNKEEFREIPPAEQPKPESTTPATTTPGAEKAPAEPEKPADPAKKPDDANSPSAEKPSQPTAPPDSPAKTPDAAKEPIPNPADKKSEEPAASPAEPSGKSEPKAEPNEPNTSDAKPSEPKLGDESAKPESSCQEEAAKEPEKPAEKSPETPAESPKPDAAPATVDAAKPADADKEQDAEKPSDAEKAKDAPTSPPEKTTADAAKPANQPAAKPGEKPAAPDVPVAPEKPKADAAPAKPAPTYKPLDDKLREEIRDRVARQKATRAAQERVDTALNEIRRLVAKYAQQKRTAELKKLTAPSPLDLEKIAADRGIEAGHIPLSDSIEVQQFELGKTFEFDFSTMQMQRIPFDMLAYRDNVPLFKPEEIRGDRFEVHFLYWKTEEKEPFVPELKEIRADVVDAWKQREAFAIAQSEAKALVDKARAAGSSLTESLGKQDNLKVTETNQFSWMTSGSVPMGMGMPALSSVDGVDHAGEEFMKSVMALKVGDVGVAENQPHSVVYVVRIASETPAEDALKEMFLQTGNSRELQFVAEVERSQLRRTWLEQIDREMAIKWERNPDS